MDKCDLGVENTGRDVSMNGFGIEMRAGKFLWTDFGKTVKQQQQQQHGNQGRATSAQPGY